MNSICMHWISSSETVTDEQGHIRVRICYESWVVPAGVPSALADIGGRVEANY